MARSYYGADDQLRVFARKGRVAYRASASRQDEYWYDALGRRVLVRSMADTVGGTTPEIVAPSTITRVVWDGDQVVAELQGIGRFTEAPSTLESDGTGTSPVEYEHPYGRVTYVEGGLDAPLAFQRDVGSSDHVIVPHTNYLGLYDDGTTSDGDPADSDIVWPGNNRRTYGALIATMTGVGWAGSLIASAQGESGLQYKRNRYYDPATGRFTQEDPIGLAGGMNLYGFAAGDPVNFSDPLGLCPEEAKDGTYCLDLFIQAKTALGLRGDNRGFDRDAPASASRAQILVDPADGTESHTISKSCMGSLCRDPLGPSDNKVSFSGGTLEFSLTNSVMFGAGPAINGTIGFSPDGKGGYTTHGDMTAFPSSALYKRVDGKWTFGGLIHAETTPFDLLNGHGRVKW